MTKIIKVKIMLNIIGKVIFKISFSIIVLSALSGNLF